MNVLEVNQVHFYILPSYQYYSSNLFNPALLIMEWMLMEISWSNKISRKCLKAAFDYKSVIIN